MPKVYLSLGSSVGDRAENIARAVAALSARGVRIVTQSLLYETEPVDMQSESWFLNAAVEAETDLPPQQLMRELLEIERSLGRHRPLASGGPKEPRTIDMDILFFGEMILHTPELDIPHPRIAERRFVLVPLAEIAPNVHHPVLGKTIPELLAATSDRSQVKLSAAPRK